MPSTPAEACVIKSQVKELGSWRAGYYLGGIYVSYNWCLF